MISKLQTWHQSLFCVIEIPFCIEDLNLSTNFDIQWWLFIQHFNIASQRLYHNGKYNNTKSQKAYINSCKGQLYVNNYYLLLITYFRYTSYAQQQTFDFKFLSHIILHEPNIRRLCVSLYGLIVVTKYVHNKIFCSYEQITMYVKMK